MIICNSRKYIFFKPLKCAGTAVEYDLLNYCTDGDLCSGSARIDAKTYDYEPLGNIRYHQHHDPFYFCETVKKMPHLKDKDFSNFRKITIVRNPWDQLVSFYWWYINSQTLSKTVNRANLICANDSLIKEKFKAVMTSKLILDHGFERKTNNVLEEFAMTNNKFMHPMITDIIKFENLDNDYYNLITKLGIQKNKTVKLKKFKSESRKLKLHYSYYYDKELIDLVSLCFKNTIERFKYNFESENG